MIVLDRLEGNRAVLDIDGEKVEIPAAALPEGAREGAVLTLGLSTDTSRLSEAQARLERLRSRDVLPDEFEL